MERIDKKYESMGMEMKYLASFVIGFFSSAVGTALFHIGSREIEKQAGEEWGEDEKMLPMKGWAAVPQKVWMSAMWAGSMILPLFLTAVYAAKTLPVLRIVLLCAVLYVCAWTDCRAYLILNKILIAALFLWIGLTAAEISLEPGNVRGLLIGSGISAAALLAAGLLCRLAVPGSVGFGDLKLFLILGLYLGADYTWSAVFYTLIASFVVSVFLLVTKRASRKSVMPFAPFLLLGTLMAAFLNGV